MHPARGLRRALVRALACALAVLLLSGLCLSRTPVASSAARPARPTAALTAHRVVSDGTLAVSGTAPAGTRRVAVQLRRAGRWQAVRRGRADRHGHYRLRVPTSWWGRRRIRIAARASRRRTSYSRVLRYTVTPGYRLAGRASQYRLTDHGYRWDPCRTIRWKYNPRGQGGAVLPDVKRAFSLMAHATGLRFRYAGRTRKEGMRSTPAAAGAEILVSWSTPVQVPLLRGRRAGLTFATADVAHRRYLAGTITLDRSHRLPTGFAARGVATWGQVVLHEVGHVLGLDHADGRRQVMYPTLHAGNHRLGAGDLAGLRALGADHGCVPAR